MKEFSILGFTLLFLTGCAGAPGYITKSVSSLDGFREYHMKPAWISGDSLTLGLFKSSKMPEDEVILTAAAAGIENISTGPSLHFKVNGETVSFTSIELLTEHEVEPGHVYYGQYVPPTTWSSKRYVVKKEFIKRIIDAERVTVRLDFTTTYIEGVFSSDMPTMARPKFRKFYEMIK